MCHVQRENPLSYKEDISFDKCSDGLFGHLPNLTKGQVEYRAYLVHIAAKRAKGTRAKNLIVKLKVQETKHCLASKKSKPVKSLGEYSSDHTPFLLQDTRK